MSQSDSNGSMTPGSASFDAFQYAQIPPILLPFIKKSVFKSEGRLCQFLAPSIARYACKQGQGPANAGHAVCKTAQSLRPITDRKSTRLNSSHGYISYAVFCLK